MPPPASASAACGADMTGAIAQQPPAPKEAPESAMKLSVMMITYNHERYIRQALDSVLMQDVDFPYEIVIGEDNSTDSTRAILLEYAGRHPEKIRLLLHDKNVGVIRNFFATMEACRGE